MRRLERISDTIKRLSGNESFKQRYDKMRQEILHAPEVKAFLQEHREELTTEVIEKNLMKLHEYSSQSKECGHCDSLENCANLMKGYYPELVLTRDSIEVHYHKCPRKLMDDEKKKNENLIKSLYVPKDILKASFYEMDKHEERANAIGKALQFVLNYREGSSNKGLYFYGQFGVEIIFARSYCK